MPGRGTPPGGAGLSPTSITNSSCAFGGVPKRSAAVCGGRGASKLERGCESCEVKLDHDGSKRLVIESCAIARYAATQFLPVSSHWWPRDDVRKSLRVDEYLHWQHLNVRTNGTLVFLHSILNPLRSKQPPNMSQIHHFNKELGKNADVMETYFLGGGKKFIAGDEISVADLFALCELTQPMCAGFNVTATRRQQTQQKKKESGKET